MLYLQEFLLQKINQCNYVCIFEQKKCSYNFQNVMKETSFFKKSLIVITLVIVNASLSIAVAKTSGTSISIISPPSLALSVYKSAVPTFTMTEITAPDLSTNIGSSDNLTINVSGMNLSGNVTMAISGPNTDQFTLSQLAVTQTGGTISNTAIRLTYSPTTTGTHSATLTFSSAGGTDVTRPLNGTSGLDNPVATAATDISGSGFKANWNEVPGATEYLIDLYSPSSNNYTQNIEGFNSGTIAPSNWTFTAISGLYTSTGSYGASSPSLRFDATGDAVTTPLSANAATEMSFWLKGQTATGSSLLVEGYNGSSWVQIDTIITPSSTAKTYKYNSTSTHPLPVNIIQFRYTYNKVTSNIAFDDVSITYPGPTTTSISGSPFTVAGSTNMVFTGLQASTDYYYSVIAKNLTISTPNSNAVHVSTITTNLANVHKKLNITATNGTLKLTGTAGETIDIYNATGQKILTRRIVEGPNSIPVSAHGVLLIKVGNRMAKVII
jgi:hypothetical protein